MLMNQHHERPIKFLQGKTISYITKQTKFNMFEALISPSTTPLLKSLFSEHQLAEKALNLMTKSKRPYI